MQWDGTGMVDWIGLDWIGIAGVGVGGDAESYAGFS